MKNGKTVISTRNGKFSRYRMTKGKKKKNESGVNRTVQADKKEKKKEMRGRGKERRNEQREGERKRKKGVFASL